MKTNSNLKQLATTSLWFAITALWAALVYYTIILTSNFPFAENTKPFIIIALSLLAIYTTTKIKTWLNKKNRDEIHELENLKKSKSTLNEVESVLKKIAEGDYEVAQKLDKSKDEAKLLLAKIGKGLAKEAIEEERRNWKNTGLATFGDYLRSSIILGEVAELVLSKLATYINASQGQLYIVENEAGNEAGNEFLSLIADYAGSGKAKINGIKIEKGEGLIGQVWIDKKLIYEKNIPDGYFKIQSASGSSSSPHLIILPLIHDTKVQGVLELASFNPYEEYQIDFLNILSENIASTIFNLQIAEQNNKLLEESQKQAKLLAEKEENMNAQLEIFNSIMAISKTDLNGKITYVNDFMVNRTGYSREELIGQTHRILKSGQTKESVYQDMWTKITKGEIFRDVIINKTKNGKYNYNDSIVAPINNKEGETIEYLSVRFDIDERVEKENKMKEAAAAMLHEKKKHEAVLDGCVDSVFIFNVKGDIEYVNKAGADLLKENRNSIIGRNIQAILPIGIVNNQEQYKIKITNRTEEKFIDIRTELSATDFENNNLDLLVTFTITEEDENKILVLFAQNITVDLF